MIEQSLIDLIATAIHNADCLDYPSHDEWAIGCAKAAIAAMGDASTRKDEEETGTTVTTSASVTSASPSEISVNALFHAVLVGGNHLASSLSATAMPPTAIHSYDEALSRFGQPYADIWCAWKAIMDAREQLSRPTEPVSVEEKKLTNEQQGELSRARDTITDDVPPYLKRQQ